MSFHVPSASRKRAGHMGTSDADGNNGVFAFDSVIPGRVAFCIASDGGGWEHVSVTIRRGKHVLTPTWEEMCQVKARFWDAEDVVVQFHPRASQYVNAHPNCLHLWRQSGVDFPTPPSEFVGPKSVRGEPSLKSALSMLAALELLGWRP